MTPGKVQAVDDGADVPEPSCKTPGASASTIKIPSLFEFVAPMDTFHTL